MQSAARTMRCEGLRAERRAVAEYPRKHLRQRLWDRPPAEPRSVRREAAQRNLAERPRGLSDRRTESSLLPARVFVDGASRPAGRQRGGNQRQQQFVVTGDRVAARLLSLAATVGGGGAPHH